MFSSIACLFYLLEASTCIKIMILWYMYLCCTFCNIHGSINTHAILHKLTSLGKYKKSDVNLSLSWKLSYLFTLSE